MASGINGVGTSQPDGIAERESTIAGSRCTATAVGDNSSTEDSCSRSVDGVRDVLDETWDTAESPNFAAALHVRTRANNESLDAGGVVTSSRVDFVI